MAKTSLNPLLPNAAISQKMIERLGKFKEYITNKDKKDTEPVRPNIPYQDREFKDIHNSYLKAIKYVRSQNIRNRDMPKDESDEFYFDKGNHKSAKYINGKYITKNALLDYQINNYAEDGTIISPQYDVSKISPRKGVRKNADGTVSTHKMAYTEADGKYYAYPTLFQDEGKWIEKDDKNDWEAFKEAKNRKEIYEFNTEKEASDFAKGSWKKDNLKQENYLPKDSDYAEDGSLYSDEPVINPNNPVPLKEATITAEAPTYIKYKQKWAKENPFDINKYVEDRFNNPVGREAIERIDEKGWRKQLKQEGLRKRQQELDEATKMGLLYQRFNPQNKDDMPIADEQFEKDMERLHIDIDMIMTLNIENTTNRLLKKQHLR